MANQRGQGRCAACRDPKIRREIDEAIAAGLSLRAAGKRFSISPTSLFRHKANHPNVSLVTVKQPPLEGVSASSGESTGQGLVDEGVSASSGESTGQGLVDETQRLVKSCWDALELASKSGSLTQVALHHRELRGSLELLARQVAQLALQRPAIAVLNIATSEEWIELRSYLLRVLRAYPEALRAVADGLAEQNL